MAIPIYIYIYIGLQMDPNLVFRFLVFHILELSPSFRLISFSCDV